MLARARPLCRCLSSCASLDPIEAAHQERRRKLGSKQFWEETYSRGEAPKEWFVSSVEVLRPILPQSGPNEKAIHLGCGVSDMGWNLAEAGFQVLDVDYSQSAIDFLLKKRAGQTPGSGTWNAVTCDLRSLPFADDSFAFALDKGTFDALVIAGDEDQALGEMFRVLKPDGLLIMVTEDSPENRWPLIAASGLPWRQKRTEKVQEGEFSFNIYSMKK